jgi:selenocysteine lyase/cysteine desulfurase
MSNHSQNDAELALAEFRKEFPILDRCIYLQTGSYAPVPLSTQQRMAEWLREENEVALRFGSKGAAPDFTQRAEEARRTLAALLNVGVEEVAWSTNTTTATRLAVCSIDWKAGDKLALTDVEHVSTMQLAEGLRQRGAAITMIATGDGPSFAPDFFLEQLDRQLTPDHRLLILCHAANTDGRRLPVAQAVQMARARGVKTLIDGAQAVGVFAVDVGGIDADFYSGSAHKWLMGPAGVGFLVVNRAQLAYYNPMFVPRLQGTERPLTAAELSEVGTPNHVLHMGAAHSITLLQQIGFAAIERHTAALSQRLRQGLRAIDGVANAGPDGWPLSSNITTIRTADGSAEQAQKLVAALRDQYQIIAKFRPEVNGVRVSIAAFNTTGDIDRLLEALTSLAPAL